MKDEALKAKRIFRSQKDFRNVKSLILIGIREQIMRGYRGSSAPCPKMSEILVMTSKAGKLEYALTNKHFDTQLSVLAAVQKNHTLRPNFFPLHFFLLTSEINEFNSRSAYYE